jgi:hypothetical protein
MRLAVPIGTSPGSYEVDWQSDVGTGGWSAAPVTVTTSKT